MAQRKKRQHTVPKTLLEGFADRGKMVAIRRRDGQGGFQTNINNATVHNYFYSFLGADGSPRKDVEDWLNAYVEGPIRPVLARFRNGEQPVASDMLTLAKFAATGLLRTATTRAYLTQVGEVVHGLITPRMKTEQYLSKPNITGLTTATATEQDRLSLDAMFAEASQKLRSPALERRGQLRIMPRQVHQFADRLAAWTWTVSGATHPCLITGDAPVVTLGPKDGGFHGLIPTGSPVLIPITARLLLVGEEHHLGLTQLTEEYVSMLNQRIADEAFGAIFCDLAIPWPSDLLFSPEPPKLPEPTITMTRAPVGSTPNFPTAYPPITDHSINNVLDSLKAEPNVD